MDATKDEVAQTHDLEWVIVRLHGLNLGELRELWQRELGGPIPPIRSPDFIRRLLAWKLQERAHGGLDRGTAKRLNDLGRAYAKNLGHLPSPNLDLKPGTVLGRRWQGVRHDVTVTREGFLYDGESFTSLSEVARHITGTRWNGPRFFGLRKPPAIKPATSDRRTADAQ